MTFVRIFVALCVAALASGAAERTTYYPVLGEDGTVRFPYGHWQASVRCEPLRVCDITLGRRESVLNVAVGDSVRWIVASAQSGPGGTTPHIFVKPTEYGLRTNLVVTTTRHDYYIDLASAHGRNASRIAFYYPEEDAQSSVVAIADAAARLTTPTPSPSPSAAPRLDFTYRIYGDESLSPHTVYNDGSHTYLMFATLPNDLPVPFAIAPDGAQQLVNYRVTGSMFVLDGIPRGVDLILNAGTGRKGRGERRSYVRHV